MKKNILKPLPAERFVVPLWKEAIVHVDQFIQFEKKCYGLPSEYRGLTLWVKSHKNLIFIYHEHQLIRQYVKPKTYRAFNPSDFPEIKREMMNWGYPKYLLEKAKTLGNLSHELIEKILLPHACLNIRRAQQVLGTLKKFVSKPYYNTVLSDALKNNIKDSKRLNILFKTEQDQLHFDMGGIPISKTGMKMVRDVKYYLN